MLLRLALAIAVFSCFASLLSAQISGTNGPQDLSQPDILTGIVLNSVTHEPVARVLVYSPDNRFATLTDDRGRFQFSFAHASDAPAAPGQSVPSARPYQLLVRKPGFLPGSGVQASPLNPSQHDITLTIVPESRIVGRVDLPPGAGQTTVELFRRQLLEGREDWQSAGVFNARSSGEYRFADLPAGAYKLFSHEITEHDPLTFDPARQFGFPPVYFPASNDFSSAAAIELAAGQTFQANLAPVRRQYFPVKVRVLNFAPDRGFQLNVYPQAHPGPGFSLGYNPNSQMVEGALPEGSYTVQLFSYGPEPLSAETTLTVGPAAGVPTLTMLPNPSLTVRVKNEMQESYGFGQSEQNPDAPPPQPSPAATYQRFFYLQILSENGFGNRQGYQANPPKDPQADFLVIEGVRPGRYHVRVNSFGLGYVASVVSGGVDLLHQPLVVSAGGSPPPIEVTLRDDGAEVTGEITPRSADSSAPSVVGFIAAGSSGRSFSYESPGFVYLIPASDSTGQFRQIWINSDGQFDALQIPPGEYRVLAFPKAHPEIESAGEEALGKFDLKSQRVTLSAGEKVKLRLSFVTEEQP